MAPIDRPALSELCANDDVLVREVLQVFVRELPQLLADVRAAVASADAAAIKRTAHRLKGALSAIVARPATAAAHALELGGSSGAQARLLVLEEALRELNVALSESA